MEFIPALPKRSRESHKGDYGHLFILGGSPGLTGAVCMAGRAAMRSGCGLVTVGVPASLNGIIEEKLTETMSKPLAETPDHTIAPAAGREIVPFLEAKADAVVLGPGISLQKETFRFIREILPVIRKPLVLDADALKAVGGMSSLVKSIKGPVIFTPHPGEMAALSGKTTEEIRRDREGTARACAKTYAAVVILKGDRSLVTDGSRLYENLTGNPGMATAGMGDVLAGILGAFLARGMSAFEAAILGVYLHGLAGDFAAQDVGEESLTAGDVIETLPEAFSFHLNSG